MRRLKFIILIICFTLLAACQTTAQVDPTEIVTEVPIVEKATATTEPTPTEVTPSMENLPAEWQGKIDRIETMTNMDGKTTRVVAIEKLSEEDIAAGKTPVLRTLQWNRSEWISYVPQVGWAGWGGWGSGANEVKSLRDESIKLPDRATLAKPLQLADGTELPLGYLGNLYNSGDRTETGSRKEYFQGYVLKVAETHSGLIIEQSSGEVAVYTGVPLPSGDWMVYISVAMNMDRNMGGAMMLDSIKSLDDFGGYFGVMDKPTLTYAELYSYLLQHGDELVGLPIIQGVGLNSEDINNAPSDELVKSIKRGELPAAFMEPIGFDISIMPESWWNKVVGK